MWMHFCSEIMFDNFFMIILLWKSVIMCLLNDPVCERNVVMAHWAHHMCVALCELSIIRSSPIKRGVRCSGVSCSQTSDYQLQLTKDLLPCTTTSTTSINVSDNTEHWSSGSIWIYVVIYLIWLKLCHKPYSRIEKRGFMIFSRQNSPAPKKHRHVTLRGLFYDVLHFVRARFFKIMHSLVDQVNQWNNFQKLWNC